MPFLSNFGSIRQRSLRGVGLHGVARVMSFFKLYLLMNLCWSDALDNLPNSPSTVSEGWSAALDGLPSPDLGDGHNAGWGDALDQLPTEDDSVVSENSNAHMSDSDPMEPCEDLLVLALPPAPLKISYDQLQNVAVHSRREEQVHGSRWRQTST